MVLVKQPKTGGFRPISRPGHQGVKGKWHLMSCGSYRGVKLLEHAIKIVERVLESQIRMLLYLDNMQFRFMLGMGMTDVLFILRRIQEGIMIRETPVLCTCVLWI